MWDSKGYNRSFISEKPGAASLELTCPHRPSYAHTKSMNLFKKRKLNPKCEPDVLDCIKEVVDIDQFYISDSDTWYLWIHSFFFLNEFLETPFASDRNIFSCVDIRKPVRNTTLNFSNFDFKIRIFQNLTFWAYMSLLSHFFMCGHKKAYVEKPIRNWRLQIIISISLR